jgi:hypothetical protein
MKLVDMDAPSKKKTPEEKKKKDAKTETDEEG